MYVTRDDMDTIHELSAFVEGQIESCEDGKYWNNFLRRTNIIRNKMSKQYGRQDFRKEVNKEVRRLTKK